MIENNVLNNNNDINFINDNPVGYEKNSKRKLLDLNSKKLKQNRNSKNL